MKTIAATLADFDRVVHLEEQRLQQKRERPSTLLPPEIQALGQTSRVRGEKASGSWEEIQVLFRKEISGRSNNKIGE